MSIYQAPQVPQPAVTFGGGNYVDLSTVNMLQAQNAALQQENVALKSAKSFIYQLSVRTSLYSSKGRIRFVKQLIAPTCENSPHIKQRVS